MFIFNFAKSFTASSLNYILAILFWDDEKEFYDYCANKKTNPSQIIGHYTQLVWENTTHVGCGKTKCPRPARGRDGWAGEIITCNYWPHGNEGMWSGYGPYKAVPGACDKKKTNGKDDGTEINNDDKNDMIAAEVRGGVGAIRLKGLLVFIATVALIEIHFAPLA